MKITNLKITNFLTIGEASLELDDRGLLLIQGVNKDDPSAESNGAGKSSIADALCWSIYGTTARGVAGDAVVNKTAKSNCGVVVSLEDAGFKYSINRFRKDKIEKNQVFVYQMNPSGVTSDLSKGTDKETQEVINAIMGCSLDVFMSAVYAGQDRMPDLPGMTDKMLKTLIEEAAGVEVLTEAYSVARDRFNKVKASLDVIVGQHTAALTNQVGLDADLANHEASSKEFEDGRRDRAKTELAKTMPLQAAVVESKAALAVWDEPATIKELDECQHKIQSHKFEQAEFNNLNAKATEADKDVASMRLKLVLKKKEMTQMEGGLANIEAQIGKPCGECAKTYCEHDLDAARQARRESIAEIRKSMLPLAVDMKAVIDRVVNAQDEAEKFKASMTDVTVVATRQRELSNLLNAIEAAKRETDRLHREIEAYKLNAGGKLTETNPWTKAIESKRVEVRRNDDKIADLNAKIEASTAEVEILADAVKVFGPGGVRAHILDTVTPYLNDRTQDYLGALADGNIHAVWSTLSTTGKGELREKFNIEVTNDMGAETFAGLSGGEKRKVRLATAMALQDMVASRATKPLDLFIADEVDHALDESGLERLMGVLERKARERGTVLVISHNSLSDWCDQILTVTKSGGYSTIDGATARGF
jgi:DNA repair exonuclease SbcCD ATPase subunit